MNLKVRHAKDDTPIGVQGHVVDPACSDL